MPSIANTVIAAESDEPEFRDVVNFLWDFNLLFELSLLAVDSKYKGFALATTYIRETVVPLIRATGCSSSFYRKNPRSA